MADKAAATMDVEVRHEARHLDVNLHACTAICSRRQLSLHTFSLGLRHNDHSEGVVGAVPRPTKFEGAFVSRLPLSFLSVHPHRLVLFESFPALPAKKSSSFGAYILSLVAHIFLVCQPHSPSLRIGELWADHSGESPWKSARSIPPSTPVVQQSLAALDPQTPLARESELPTVPRKPSSTCCVATMHSRA